MTCEKCGAQVPEGQSTCPNCGAGVAPGLPSAPEAAPVVPTPPAQQPAAPPPPPQQYAGYPPYPYGPPQYAWPAAEPRRPRKPVVVIIIAILTFVGALGCLLQTAAGQPAPFFGFVATGAAARLIALGWGLVAIAVGVGLLLMSRWGWWLAIIESALSLLTSLLALPNIHTIVSTTLQRQPFPAPPDMDFMPMMEGMMTAIVAASMILGALLQIAIIAYLIWKRELFGIDVEPAPPPS